MECDLLIDFKSPQRSSGNILDPLVPLPKVQTRNIPNNETGKTIGDNPFDEVFLELCQEADPFDIIEKETQETHHKNNEPSQEIARSYCQPVCVQDQRCEEIKDRASVSLCVETSPKVSKISLSCGQLCYNQSSLFLEKSASESCLSPMSERIENKFSKLYLSAQFDKQLLDESSKCIDSDMQDVSVEFSSASELSPRPTNLITVDLPNKEEVLKAFIANRIEKCIEKATCETRKSLNSSSRHRRSLSATSLYSGLGTKIKSERAFSSTNIQQSCGNWIDTVRSYLNKPESEKFRSSSITDRFNTAFRKSTATSSMYSSYGLLETGFQKCSTALSSYRESSNSFNLSLPQTSEDSVFTRSSLNVYPKSTDSVLLEARNLSCVLKRRACSEGDEPWDCDNFLTDGKLDIQLVDSDSSEDEDKDDQIRSQPQSCPEKIQGNNQPILVKEAASFENTASLSRANVAESSLASKIVQPKKTHHPLMALPIPVPVKTGTNTKELVLRPKANIERRVVAKGPMRAMIPVGSMVRSNSEKSQMPGRTAAGPDMKKGLMKFATSASSLLRKSSLRGSKGSPNIRQIGVAAHETGSPIPLCAQPVACSTPAADAPPPLVSPSVALQVSRISPSPLQDGHRRSRSAGCQQNSKVEHTLSSTPARKPPRRIRSEDGRLKNKLKSPMQASPQEPPAFTSTPLKQISKNSPPVNRMKHTSVSRKLVHPSEKENLLPTREMRGPRASSRTSRI